MTDAAVMMASRRLPMATMVLIECLQMEIEHYIGVAEVRNPQGNVVGQFIPSQEQAKRIYDRAWAEIYR
jgi:hypothetical protein